MSVNPGFGGQELIPEVLPKIKELRRLLGQKGRRAELEVDGGIKVDNIGVAAGAGADVFVSGSGIFGTKDYAQTIASMKNIISPPRPRGSRSIKE